MQIKGAKVLVLGGWGLVGSAICRKLMIHEPSKLIVSSLKRSEAEEAIEDLRSEYPDKNPEMFEAKWGNVFTRTDWKDIDFGNVLGTESHRKAHIKDIFFELSDEVLNNSALYKLIEETKPDIVIDCINTATAIAYLNIYDTAIKAINRIDGGDLDEAIVEQIIASSYIPQLIRHTQIMYRGLVDAGTGMYFKVGTSGTGGMGFNIPFTHSEERPSRVLLSKTAVAGAQTLLLYILARTPEGPLVKEIKPAATIAWKKIAYGEVKKRGKAIELVDMDLQNAKPVQGDFIFNDHEDVIDTGDTYKSVFIDTGENGIFSKGEFETISALGQMEIVTPEEIAEYLVHEIRGGNTGRDVIAGLDATTLGPTYRGGVLRNKAIDLINKLEKENNTDSIAFEMLGPPRLSKLLFEAYFVRLISGSINEFLKSDMTEFSKKALDLIKENDELRREMLSIGLVILMPDGKSYLRGKMVKIPVQRYADKLELSEANINQWCQEGWIDLRPSNFEEWKTRFENMKSQAEAQPAGDTSSRFYHDMEHWQNFDTVEEGKITAWIFENEDKGWRFKR